MFGFMKQEIAKGRQVYVVYPLIKESETLDLKNLTDGVEVMSIEFPLPEYRISVVHGKLKPAEKQFEMDRFIKGETQIMVATTVIEVGVNIPNASVMVIENAERFGLSQLHQLRGRVGRLDVQAYAYFIVQKRELQSEISRQRLRALEKHSDLGAGFHIAFEDLQIRGAGNLLGAQQHGFITSIGFDLYCRLLKESIEHLKKEVQIKHGS